MANNKPKPFTYKFVNDGSNVLLELTNATKETLKSVEILTVFLKNEKRQAGVLRRFIFDSRLSNGFYRQRDRSCITQSG